MKVFHLGSQRIFLSEAGIEDSFYVQFYEKLFQHLLDFRSVSDNKCCELLNLINNHISSKPFNTQRILRKIELPAFMFLLYKN